MLREGDASGSPEENRSVYDPDGVEGLPQKGGEAPGAQGGSTVRREVKVAYGGLNHEGPHGPAPADGVVPGK